jgi:transcription-repair coupling factor (superfamily II helicase)
VQLGDLALMHGEVQDRYGDPPEPVERLFEVMQIRLLAKQLRLQSVVAQPDAVVITFDPKAKIPEAAVHRLMDHHKKRLRFLSPLSFELRMPHEDWGSTFQELNATLQTLQLCDTTKASHNERLP